MAQPSADLISPSEAVTLDGLFRARVRHSPLATAYIAHNGNAWVATSWAQMGWEVARWQAALQRERLAAGERVGILLRNGPAWVQCEQAILALGLVVVPLYVEDRAENSAFILTDANVRVLVVQDERHWHRLAAAIDGCPQLQRVVLLNGLPELEDRIAVSAIDWLPKEAMEQEERVGEPGALATIVYTSGTIGRPKGVMLSHRNILADAWACARFSEGLFHRADRFLSFMPLSHTFERTAGYYLPMIIGSAVAYARSVQQLAEDLPMLQPTVIVAVPRLFERIYARIEKQLAGKGRLSRALFRLTQEVGWQRFEESQGRGTGSWRLMLWPLLDALVASKVRALFGGRLRFAISGGAALPPEVSRYFIGLGLEVLQGYGLTESAPVVSCNLPRDNDPTTVGRPLPGVEVQIGEDDELLVRGPNVMLGYWNDHDDATPVIDLFDWLHTGDRARLVDGRIQITGRSKEILVLSNGEKVPPADIETAVGLDPLVEFAVVVGEGRAWLGMLVALDPGQWAVLAGELGLAPDAAASLTNRALHRQLLARFNQRLSQFPGYTRIRRLVLILDPWTVENGMLTPTMKLRRQRVQERYADAIEQLFASPAP